MSRHFFKLEVLNGRVPQFGRVILCILGLSAHAVVAFTAEENRTLHADYRQRPPEMVIEESTGAFSGPLIDVLEEGASRLGYQVKWRKAPFQRSYRDLQFGNVDVVPRVILTEERKAFIAYLGPIGCQRKDILFLVRKGEENLLNTYEDLTRVTIGTKKDTAYFDRFNKDKRLKKVLSLDDLNMSRMFAAGRFDTMIILDKGAIEKAMRNINFTDYSYANYRYAQLIGNYYGMSKKSSHIDRYSDLNEALRELARAGRVKQIYAKHNVSPPADCD
jgi:polar amino acid transport system substrate-binding protein